MFRRHWWRAAAEAFFERSGIRATIELSTDSQRLPRSVGVFQFESQRISGDSLRQPNHVPDYGVSVAKGIDTIISVPIPLD
jgi:hypothetical protein